jgi:hypothetical protein
LVKALSNNFKEEIKEKKPKKKRKTKETIQKLGFEPYSRTP